MGIRRIRLWQKGMTLVLVVGLGIGSPLPPMLQAYCGLPWMVERMLHAGEAGLAPRAPDFLAHIEQLSTFLSYTAQFHLVLEQGSHLLRGTQAPFWAQGPSTRGALAFLLPSGEGYVFALATEGIILNHLRRVVWPQGP